MKVIKISDYLAKRAEASATSNESAAAERLASVYEHAQSRITNWIPIAIAALQEIEIRCTRDNWDAEGALSIDSLTLERTFALIQKINGYNLSIPAPDIDADCDGEIALTWNNGPSRVLSISVGSHEILNFAGRLRDRVRCNGTEIFAPERDENDALTSTVSRLKILYDLGAVSRSGIPLRRNQQLGV